MKPNYRILIDYGSYEGMKFWDETGFDTVDLAVKEALSLRLSCPFLIVQVVDWEAKEKP